MCSKCKEKIHPKIKLADRHKIVNIKDIASVNFVDKHDFTSISCPFHDDKLCCLYCKSCDEASCSLCVTRTHSNHDMIELSEGYSIYINKIKRFTMQINERIKFIKLSEIIRYYDGKTKMLM